MHERLVESWLDSASERSYQVPFAQMLVAQGHRIIHSTRHAPIEFGKDIITIDPEGAPCAFQLKGHPGGRLTSAGVAEIIPQLRQLTDFAITHSGVPRKPHKSYFVTNGFVDEEASLAIERLNEGNVIAGHPERRVNIVQRGDLLAMAQRLGHALWPTEISQVHLLLQMLVEDGARRYPAGRANEMLTGVLGLASRQRWGAAEIRRRVTSAALMTSLSLMRFNERRNHAAGVTAWTQFAAAAIATCERYEVSVNRNAAASIELAMTAIRDLLIDLAREALDRDVLVEGDAPIDGIFYRARYTELLGLMSLLWFWCERDGWPQELEERAVRRFLIDGKDHLFLWGEGALPQALMYYWFVRKHLPARTTDALLAGFLWATAHANDEHEPQGLASPYWRYESVARHMLSDLLGQDGDEMARESTGGRSYFAEGLLHLLVRTNRKQTCKQLWPNISRTLFLQFIPERRWQYCLVHNDEGTIQHTQPPLRKEWRDLVDEAREIGCTSVPKALVERPMLHSAFLLQFPYRATSEAIRTLSQAFDRTWLLADPPRFVDGGAYPL